MCGWRRGHTRNKELYPAKFLIIVNDSHGYGIMYMDVKGNVTIKSQYLISNVRGRGRFDPTMHENETYADYDRRFRAYVIRRNKIMFSMFLNTGLNPNTKIYYFSNEIDKRKTDYMYSIVHFLAGIFGCHFVMLPPNNIVAKIVEVHGYGFLSFTTARKEKRKTKAKRDLGSRKQISVKKLINRMKWGTPLQNYFQKLFTFLYENQLCPWITDEIYFSTNPSVPNPKAPPCQRKYRNRVMILCTGLYYACLLQRRADKDAARELRKQQAKELMNKQNEQSENNNIPS